MLRCDSMSRRSKKWQVTCNRAYRIRPQIRLSLEIEIHGCDLLSTGFDTFNF